MKYTYNLGEVDYHQHLLFTISTSSSAIKTRAQIRLLMTISLLLFAFISYGNGSTGQMVYFIFLAVLAFLLMPFYTRWSYKKTYLKHVRNYYKERMSEPTTIEVNEQSISISDSHGASSMNWNELEEINELADYCFLKVKSGQSIIIPLRQIEHSTEFISFLKNTATRNSIQWNQQIDWVWK